MAKRTVEEEAERNRNKTKRLYRASDEYATNQAWRSFKERDGKVVVEVSIMELAERLRAILGGKRE